jgi:hypothetical protein
MCGCAEISGERRVFWWWFELLSVSIELLVDPVNPSNQPKSTKNQPKITQNQPKINP